MTVLKPPSANALSGKLVVLRQQQGGGPSMAGETMATEEVAEGHCFGWGSYIHACKTRKHTYILRCMCLHDVWHTSETENTEEMLPILCVRMMCAEMAYKWNWKYGREATSIVILLYTAVYYGYMHSEFDMQPHSSDFPTRFRVPPHLQGNSEGALQAWFVKVTLTSHWEVISRGVSGNMKCPLKRHCQDCDPLQLQ